MQPVTVQQLGRRERGKLDKRRRIREATREVFRQKGYEDATTREIADRADVAIGTLFAYAADKRELLMMVVNDDRESFPEVGQNVVDGPRDVLQLLMSFFEPRYRYWAKEPELSRAVVQETVTYHLTKKPGPELARFYVGRQMMIDSLTQFFEREQLRGQIVRSASPKAIAELFMTIYQGEVRRWLQAERPGASDGLKRLRQSFSLALSGVKICAT
jgi:AcrR family transcriptional regulator